MSRCAAEQAAAQQAAADVDSGGTSRRSSDRTMGLRQRLGRERARGEEGGAAADREQGEGAHGRQQANDKSPHGESPFRALQDLTRFGRNGLARRQASPRPGIEPVVAHQHGRRLPADRPQAVIEAPHREPKVGCDEGLRREADLELRAQRQPAQAHPDDVIPGEAAVAAEAQRDAVVVDDDLRFAIARAADAQDHVVDAAPAPSMKNSTKRGSFSDSVGALVGLLMKCRIATRDHAQPRPRPC